MAAFPDGCKLRPDRALHARRRARITHRAEPAWYPERAETRMVQDERESLTATGVITGASHGSKLLLLLFGALALACGGDNDESAASLPPVTAECGPLEAQLALDGGEARVFALPAVPTVQPYVTGAWRYFQHTEKVFSGGLFVIDGTGAVPGQFGQPFEGETLSVTRAWLAPDTGAAKTLGTSYAVSPGSGSLLSRRGDQLVVDLRKAATLQDCSAGQPIAGEIDLCFRADLFTDCPASAGGGSVDGKAWTSRPSGWSGALYRMEATLTGDAALLRGETSGTGAILWAAVVTNVVGPFEGKVLCAGEGSEVVEIPAGDGAHRVWQLRSLRVLEGVGPSRLTGCMR
jgi:hypothetical protein